MEALLSSMTTLASHDAILQCSPISEYSEKLRYGIHVQCTCTVRGTFLIRTPLGQKKVSQLVRCPDFRG